MKLAIAFVLALCVVSICPATAFTRFFSSSFQELRATLYRYTYCYGDYPVYKTDKLNETEYLVHQIKYFLDQGNYTSDQLANVSLLMDNICRPDSSNYPISVNIDVNKYVNTTGKEHRCSAIDQALNSMYYVLRSAAWNQSEPLDFSTIYYYPVPNDKSKHYNLTDLINTSWIKSDVNLEHVCFITESIKNYVAEESTREFRKFQVRAEKPSGNGARSPGFLRGILDHLYGLIDLVNGYQRRIALGTSNTFDQFTTGLSKRVSSVRSTLSSTRSRLTGMIFSNATSRASNNATTTITSPEVSPIALNTTTANQ